MPFTPFTGWLSRTSCTSPSGRCSSRLARHSSSLASPAGSRTVSAGIRSNTSFLRFSSASSSSMIFTWDCRNFARSMRPRRTTSAGGLAAILVDLGRYDRSARSSAQCLSATYQHNLASALMWRTTHLSNSGKRKRWGTFVSISIWRRRSSVDQQDAHADARLRSRTSVDAVIVDEVASKHNRILRSVLRRSAPLYSQGTGTHHRMDVPRWDDPAHQLRL